MHMSKSKVDKLKAKSKVYQFVGYPKGATSYYLYSKIDQKVFVSINSKFLEEDYITSNKAKE